MGLVAGLLVGVSSSLSGQALRDQEFDPGPTGGNGVLSDQALGQTFTVGISGYLVAVEFGLFKEGKPSSNLEIELRRIADTIPDESTPGLVCQGSLAPIEIPGDTIKKTSFVNVPLRGPFMKAGERWALVLRSKESSVFNCLNWTRAYGNGYARGDGLCWQPKPGWFQPAIIDHAFKTYMSATPLPEPEGLTNLTIRVSSIELSWSSISNQPYQVQYRSELTTNLWKDLTAPVMGNGATNCLSDLLPPREPRRFYRVVLLPH